MEAMPQSTPTTRRAPPAISRRRLLAGVAAVALVPPPAFGSAPAPDGFHLVNGWILTTRDLAALGLR